MRENSPPPTDAQLPYCRGCGHAAVVRHLARALERLKLPVRSLVLTTDIGGVGLADSLFPYLHTVHTTHGRSTAFATGMAMADSLDEPTGLKPVVMIGDGGAMIGLLHLVHAAQLNVDITVLVHNNFLFGMTGGQHSALTPLGFVTATTKAGNWIPPLDLLAILRAAHAGFLGRYSATDPDLEIAIADAIAHPGFALVEILELCTAYGTRWNRLTGSTLEHLARSQGYQMGRREAGQDRLPFSDLCRRRPESPRVPSSPRALPEITGRSPLSNEIHLVLAGSAGERVQSAAALLCEAAVAAGLYATQKNDNPVTQGSGFSLAELCLSPWPIEYTGLEFADAVIVVSADGWKELEANGTFSRCGPETLLIVDEGLTQPPARGRLLRLPLRRAALPKRAALAALAAWAAFVSVLPEASWKAALTDLTEKRRSESGEAISLGKQFIEQRPELQEI